MTVLVNNVTVLSIMSQLDTVLTIMSQLDTVLTVLSKVSSIEAKTVTDYLRIFRQNGVIETFMTKRCKCDIYDQMGFMTKRCLLPGVQTKRSLVNTQWPP